MKEIGLGISLLALCLAGYNWMQTNKPEILVEWNLLSQEENIDQKEERIRELEAETTQNRATINRLDTTISRLRRWVLEDRLGLNDWTSIDKEDSGFAVLESNTDFILIPTTVEQFKGGVKVEGSIVNKSSLVYMKPEFTFKARKSTYVDGEFKDSNVEEKTLQLPRISPANATNFELYYPNRSIEDNYFTVRYSTGTVRYTPDK